MKELSQLYYLNIEIEQQKKELLKLEQERDSIPIDLLEHKKGQNVAEVACRIADLKALISINIEKCYYERKRLIEYINSIDDSFIRTLLTLRFVNGYTWNEVAASVGGKNTEDSVRKTVVRFVYKK